MEKWKLHHIRNLVVKILNQPMWNLSLENALSKIFHPYTWYTLRLSILLDIYGLTKDYSTYMQIICLILTRSPCQGGITLSLQ